MAVLSHVLTRGLLLGGALWIGVAQAQFQHTDISAHSRVPARQLVVPTILTPPNPVHRRSDDAPDANSGPGMAYDTKGRVDYWEGNHQRRDENVKQPLASSSNGPSGVGGTNFDANREKFENNRAGADNGAGASNTGSGQPVNELPSEGTVGNRRDKFEELSSRPGGTQSGQQTGEPGSSKVSDLIDKYENMASNPATAQPVNPVKPAELPKAGTVQDLANKYENHGSSSGPSSNSNPDANPQSLDPSSNPNPNPNPDASPQPLDPSSNANPNANPDTNPQPSDPSLNPNPDANPQPSISDQLVDWSSHDSKGNLISPPASPKSGTPASGPNAVHHDTINTWERVSNKDAKKLPESTYDAEDPALHPGSSSTEVEMAKSDAIEMEQLEKSLRDAQAGRAALKGKGKGNGKGKGKGKGKGAPEGPPMVQSPQVENGKITSLKTHVPRPKSPLPAPPPGCMITADNPMRLALDDIRIKRKLTQKTADNLVASGWGITPATENVLRENNVHVDNMSRAKGAISGWGAVAYLAPAGLMADAPGVLEMSALAGSPEILGAIGVKTAAPEVAKVVSEAQTLLHSAVSGTTAGSMSEAALEQGVVAAQVVGVAGKEILREIATAASAVAKSSREMIAIGVVGLGLGVSLGGGLGLIGGLIGGLFARKHIKDNARIAVTTVHNTVWNVQSKTMIEHITETLQGKTITVEKTKAPEPTTVWKVQSKTVIEHITETLQGKTITVEKTKVPEPTTAGASKSSQGKTQGSSASSSSASSSSASKSTEMITTTANPSKTTSPLPNETGKGPIVTPLVVIPIIGGDKTTSVFWSNSTTSLTAKKTSSEPTSSRWIPPTTHNASSTSSILKSPWSTGRPVSPPYPRLNETQPVGAGQNGTLPIISTPTKVNGTNSSQATGTLTVVRPDYSFTNSTEFGGLGNGTRPSLTTASKSPILVSIPTQVVNITSATLRWQNITASSSQRMILVPLTSVAMPTMPPSTSSFPQWRNTTSPSTSSSPQWRNTTLATVMTSMPTPEEQVPLTSTVFPSIAASTFSIVPQWLRATPSSAIPIVIQETAQPSTSALLSFLTLPADTLSTVSPNARSTPATKILQLGQPSKTTLLTFPTSALGTSSPKPQLQDMSSTSSNRPTATTTQPWTNCTQPVPTTFKTMTRTMTKLSHSLTPPLLDKTSSVIPIVPVS